VGTEEETQEENPGTGMGNSFSGSNWVLCVDFSVGFVPLWLVLQFSGRRTGPKAEFLGACGCGERSKPEELLGFDILSVRFLGGRPKMSRSHPHSNTLIRASRLPVALPSGVEGHRHGTVPACPLKSAVPGR